MPGDRDDRESPATDRAEPGAHGLGLIDEHRAALGPRPGTTIGSAAPGDGRRLGIVGGAARLLERVSGEARPWSRGEELANSVSHGLGLLGSLAVAPLLVEGGWSVGGPAGATAAAIFCGALVLVYLASTLHHALPAGRAKRTVEVVDRAAIFVLIAGTYTPFAVGVLWGIWGWLLLGASWTLAAFGVARTIARGTERPYQATRLYLAMGWMIVLVAGPVVERMHPTGLLLVLAGGLAYTVGVAFYVMQRLKYHHLVWHLFVILGSACHVLAAWRYAAA